MKENFDFDKIGKRMPYTTPDGFFDEMQASVMKKVARPKRSYMQVAIRSIVAMAAAVTLFLVFQMNIPKSSSANDYADVDLAFNNLSTEDQAYILEVYQNDVFMTEY